MIDNYRSILYKSYDVQLNNNKAVDMQWKKRLINKLFRKNYLPHFPVDKAISILDIGCGNGLYLFTLKELGYHNVTGTDLSKANVDICKENGVKCELIDGIDYLADKNDTFGVILFNHVIEHLTKDECMNMILAMKNALKENGIIIVTTPNLANPFTGAASRYIDFTHETGFTERSLKQVFLATGFKDVRIYGFKIFVMNNPLFWIACLFQHIVSFWLFLMTYLYGFNQIKIFTASILAVVRK